MKSEKELNEKCRELTDDELENVIGGNGLDEALKRLAEKTKVHSESPDEGGYQVSDQQHYGTPGNTGTTTDIQ